MSQANELLCCFPDLDTGIHSFRLQLCVCGSERRDPSAFRPLTSKESEFQMCKTEYFENFSPGDTKINF